MFLLLKNKNLLNDGYISFGPADDGKNWNHALDQLTKMYAGHKKIRKIIANNSDVVDMNPLYLDTHDLVTNRAIHEDSVNQFYNETYLSVINETTYHEDVVFFSEKTFKAIAMGHPFILATASNSLPYLKELGYKTFHPMIDESYDTIKDHGDRMLAIVDEVERICNLEESKLIEWLDCVEPICKHNQAILNKKKILTKPMNY